MGQVDDVRIEGVVPVFAAGGRIRQLDFGVLPVVRVGDDLLQQDAGGHDVLAPDIRQAFDIDAARKGALGLEGVIRIGKGLDEMSVVTVQLEDGDFGFLRRRIHLLGAPAGGADQHACKQQER